jgi:hypothetical protein
MEDLQFFGAQDEFLSLRQALHRKFNKVPHAGRLCRSASVVKIKAVGVTYMFKQKRYKSPGTDM